MQCAKRAIGLAIILGIGAWSPDGGADVLAPDAKYRGRTLDEWGMRWLEWMVAIPFEHFPALDATGADCAIDQNGPVWYLASNFGGETTRSCTIPKDKAIFVSPFMYLNDYPCPDPAFEPAPGQSLEDFLTEGARAVVDLVADVQFEVDGVAVADPFANRATSRLFRFAADPSNITIDPCFTGKPQPGVLDGYWFLVEPLAPGPHSIRFSATVPAFGLSLDVTYAITVAD